MRRPLAFGFTLFALTAVTALAQTPCSFQGDYYDPVDTHPGLSFGENQKRLLNWMGCDPNHPETCVVSDQHPRLLDTANLRSHAWEVFAALTAPASTYQPAQSLGVTMPRWITWYTYDEVFLPPSSRVTIVKLRQPLQLEERSGNLTSEVRYNKPTCEDIRTKQLNTKAALAKLLADGQKIRLPDDSIAIKTTWLPVAGSGCTEIPVFDSRRPGPAGNFTIQNWRRVAVSPDGQYGSCDQTLNRVPLNQFFYLPASLVKPDSSLRIETQGSRPVNFQTDFFVLTGFHFTTREVPSWVWATFWWHDYPVAGPYAENRPLDGLLAPWNHYLMNVAYDMEFPRETSGDPKIAFNPYLEGAMDNGSQSNCVTCHSRASWPPAKSRQTLVSGSQPRRAGQIVVRGTEAARSTYFPENQSSLYLDFIWSLSHPPPE